MGKGFPGKEITCAKSRVLKNMTFSGNRKKILVAGAWSAKEVIIGDRANKSDFGIIAEGLICHRINLNFLLYIIDRQ